MIFSDAVADNCMQILKVTKTLETNTSGHHTMTHVNNYTAPTSSGHVKESLCHQARPRTGTLPHLMSGRSSCPRRGMPQVPGIVALGTGLPFRSSKCGGRGFNCASVLRAYGEALVIPRNRRHARNSGVARVVAHLGQQGIHVVGFHLTTGRPFEKHVVVSTGTILQPSMQAQSLRFTRHSHQM